jgi:PAS domain S-box-containing protein
LKPDQPAVEPSDGNLTYKNAPDLTWLNRRLRELLMQAPSAIGITAGPEHRWAYVNLARVRMAGRSSVHEFVGKSVRETYPELEGMAFFAALDQVYRTGVPFIGKELPAPFRRGPGGTIDIAYVDCVYQPIRADNGEVEGVLIHTVEVTEQVLARRAIEIANEREKQQRAAAEFERNQLRELFKQAPAGIAILSGTEHRWSFVNYAFAEMLGRSFAELQDRTVREAFPELAGQGFFELLDDVYRTGVPFVGKELKAVFQHHAGQPAGEAYFNFVYQPVRNVAGETEGIMALAVDVTQQIQARTQLETAVEQRTLELQQAHETLQRLSGNLMQTQDEERRRVARELHDSIGQYLAAIQINLSMLSDEAESLSERARRRLQECIDLAGRSNTEIRTISYLLHPPLLDEMGLASAISWYAEGFSERSGIEVILEIPSNWTRLSGELETALFRVVQQSLANVHRHSGTKVARIRLARDGNHVTAEIADQGRGIPPELLARFRRQGQLPGVGISGMRERIHGMGGTFTLTSDAKGTTIAVSVPVHGSVA